MHVGEAQWDDANWLEHLAQTFGTPLIAYDGNAIDTATARLQQAFGATGHIAYSVKANPAPGILKKMIKAGVGAEVASVGELRLCLKAGFDPGRILFAGPGKDAEDLSTAVAARIRAIMVESLDELVEIDRIAAGLGVVADVALRLNLPDASKSLAYGWRTTSPFGIAPEQLPDVLALLPRLAHVRCIGIHHHHGSQIFDAELVTARLQVIVAAALALAAQIDLQFIDVGGGFAAPYYADDPATDLGSVESAVAALHAPGAALADSGITLIAESGRYLVGPAGYYIARVAAVKSAYGVRFAVLDGGINHMLSMSGVFRTVGRPVDAFVPGRGESACVDTELAGPLCTPVDRIGSRVPLPVDLKRGDLVVFRGQGAYAKHASPLNFLGHSWPAEVLVEGGQLTHLARRVDFGELIDLQAVREG